MQCNRAKPWQSAYDAMSFFYEMSELQKNLNKWMEKSNERRSFHTGTLHGAMKQLTSNHPVLCVMCKSAE